MIQSNNNIKPLIQGATAFVAVSAICVAIAHNAGRIYKVIETAKGIGAPIIVAATASSIVLGASIDAATRYLLTKIFKVTNPILLHSISTVIALAVNTTAAILLTSFQIIPLAIPPGGLLIMLCTGSFLIYKFFNLTDVLSPDPVQKQLTPPAINLNSDTNTSTPTPAGDEMSMNEKKQVLRELLTKTPHIVFGAPVLAFLKPFFKDDKIRVFEELKDEWKTLVPIILDKITIEDKIDKNKKIPLTKLIETEYDKVMKDVNDEPLLLFFMNSFLHGKPQHCRWILEEVFTSITEEINLFSAKDSNRIEAYHTKTPNFLRKFINDEAAEIIRLNSIKNSSSRLIPPTQSKWQAWNPNLSKQQQNLIAKEWKLHEFLIKKEKADRESNLPFYCNFLSAKYFLPANLLFINSTHVLKWLFKTQFLESGLLWGLEKFKNYLSSKEQKKANEEKSVAPDEIKNSNNSVNSENIQLVKEHLPFVMKLIETLAPSIHDLYDWKYYINHFKVRKELIESTTQPDKEETVKLLLEFYQKLAGEVLAKGNIADAIDSSLISVTLLIEEGAQKNAQKNVVA